MLKRLLLENFMSHRRTELEFSEGLTVLIGRNNCGKSAVVAALEALCTNPPAEYAIRHGEKMARVTVETIDGHTIEWERKANTAMYRIDGETFHRLGRGRENVPVELHQILKMPCVNLEDRNTSVNIHIGSQKTPIFEVLLDSALAASFFASSSDASRLLEMQKLHREKVTRARQAEKQLTRQATGFEREVALLNPIVALQAEVQNARHRNQEMAAQDKAAEALARLILDMERAAQSIDRRENKCHVYTPLREVPTFHDDVRLEDLISDIQATATDLHHGEAILQSVTQLSAVPEFADTANLSDLIAKISQASANSNRLDRVNGELAKVVELPEFVDADPLEALLQKMTASKRAMSEAELKVQRVTNEYADMARMIEEFLKENPACPLCGSELDRDAMIHGGHDHG